MPESVLDTTLLDSLGTPVFVVRPPGVLSFMNTAAREMTGGEPQLGWPAPESEPAIRAALAGQESEGESAFTNPATGEQHVVRYVVRPVRESSGAVVAAVATLHDLSEVRRIEQQREEFLSIVSHELRTPLTPLKALAQLLVSRIRRSRERAQPMDLDSLERNLASIERQVDRMNGLVSDLLSVSRAGRGRLEMDRAPFDLATTVREVVERYVQATREEKRHTFAVDAPQTLTVDADRSRIDQILTNLIANAVKYSPRGGEVLVTLAQRDGTAEITVTDRGIGVSAADLPRLGGAFVRGTGKAATFAGMGIGLHVAKLIADAHGGSLTIESEGEDRGTTVRVVLPT